MKQATKRKQLPELDPVVKEIHEFRENFAARFNFDLDAIARELRRLEKLDQKAGVKFVDLSARLQKPKRPKVA